MAEGRRREAATGGPKDVVAAGRLDLEEWPLDRVQPYPGNPRRNAAAVAAVAESLRAFGWRQPLVVDAAGVIIAGHTRWLAARELGWATIPVHVARNLTPERARAYRLADNRTAELAAWDADLLRGELDALADLDLGDLDLDAL